MKSHGSFIEKGISIFLVETRVLLRFVSTAKPNCFFFDFSASRVFGERLLRHNRVTVITVYKIEKKHHFVLSSQAIRIK